MSIDLAAARSHLQRFELRELFLEELGWGRARGAPVAFPALEATLTRRPIAELSGVFVFEVTSADGSLPEARVRRAALQATAEQHHEHVLVFLDAERSKSVWCWGKRDGARLVPREATFVRGQSGDLFLPKLAALVVGLAELDERGSLPATHVARKLAQALDVQRVTKRFFEDYQQHHALLLAALVGLPDERDRRWYASVLLNRLMFVYFLQKKGFLDRGNFGYLREKLEASRQEAPDRFFRGFLARLFFEGFARPEAERSAEARRQLGEIRYLNGGLFLPHALEQRSPDLDVPDAPFAALFDLFDRYSWHLDDTPGGQDDEINPDVLGSIFEKYINQKAFGAYYTRPEITEHLCEQTLHRLILDRLHELDRDERRWESLGELLLHLDDALCRRLLLEVLPRLSVLDPACGSGAFLVAALKVLLNVYAAAIGFAKLSKDPTLRAWLEKAEREHSSLPYYLKKRVITDNLFGVDLMEEAVEIARLRLFLALVASASAAEDLEPLPNIDFNLLAGNSLIGLLTVDPDAFDRHSGNGQMGLFRRSFTELLADKNRKIDSYRHASQYGENLRALRDGIEAEHAEATKTLDELLLKRFSNAKIQVEAARWNAASRRPGKPEKRAVRFADVRALHPFHWGYEFDEILVTRGGFDVVLTNPPWETWKPQAKEFFAEHSGLVSKNKMTIKDFEAEQERLLEDPEVAAAWLAYLSRFPHVSQFFRKTEDYQHQAGEVDGKKRSGDLNLYKLFLERCFQLLRPGGRCGILIPTGFYTDLGTKGLRELLFDQARIETLFGLSNEKFLFDGVHHSFRICLLAFVKGGRTDRFQAAFRINPREAIRAEDLEAFLHDREQHLELSVDLIRRLSASSLSILELKSPLEVRIAEKMLQFPTLGEELPDRWNVKLANEFHMTNDSHLFKTEPGEGRLPLIEGKMFQQYESGTDAARYWLDEVEARAALAKAHYAPSAKFGYEGFRLAFRDIARSTDARTVIATILPPRAFCPHTVSLEDPLFPFAPTLRGLTMEERLYLLAAFNSLCFDYQLRQKVTTHVSFFLVYGTPLPRLLTSDPDFAPIVERAARLVCTTPAYADLWQTALGRPWTPADAATDPTERQRFRADLDATFARLYQLTRPELDHILTTFPLVTDEYKAAVRAGFGG